MPSVTTALAHIDEDIVRYKLLLCNLYTKRNTLSLISRLPNELLASIFIHYARDYFESKGTPSTHAPPWVNVSYVCSHWRNVALNCPILWSYVFTMSHRWTDVLLARSEYAPLKIRVNVKRGENTWWSKFVEKLVDHVERIEDLRLRHFWWDSREHQIFSKLCSSASHLQKLDFSMEFTSYRLPGGFANRSTPPSWQSYSLSGLTTLSLHSIPPSFRQGIAKFLAALSCMQDLAYLYLDDAITSARDFISGMELNPFPKIDLHHLSRLLIIAPVSTIIAFFSCVNIPVRAEIRLECGYEHDMEGNSTLHDYTQLYSVLAQHYNQDRVLSLPAIRSMAIHHGWQCVMLVFSASTRCDYNPSLYSTPDLTPLKWGCNIPLKIIVHFDLSGYREETDKHKITLPSNICSFMPITNVQSLHAIRPPFCSAFWVKTLGCLSDLRHIKLSEGDMPDLASAMLSHSVHESLYRDRILAPALEELELCGIKFLSGLESGKGVDRPVADLQSLYDALSSRTESQIRVTMTRCAIDGGRTSFTTLLNGGGVVTVDSGD